MMAGSMNDWSRAADAGFPVGSAALMLRAAVHWARGISPHLEDLISSSAPLTIRDAAGDHPRLTGYMVKGHPGTLSIRVEDDRLVAEAALSDPASRNTTSIRVEIALPGRFRPGVAA